MNHNEIKFKSKEMSNKITIDTELTPNVKLSNEISLKFELPKISKHKSRILSKFKL